MDASSTTYIYERDKDDDRECILCEKGCLGLFCKSCNMKFTLLKTDKALEIFNLVVYKLEELVDAEKENE